MPTILLVDDNPGMIQVMGRVLAGTATLRFATRGVDALQMASSSPPDLVLLDSEMPGLSGYEVCAALKADPKLADIPVIFVTAHDDLGSELKGFEAGAVDFIAKPISEPVLLARVKTHLKLKQVTDDLRRIATLDGLTGVANRRRFNETLPREWRRALRAREPVSLLMIDLDGFKDFNDRYGHPAGDACVSAVAGALRGVSLRAGDLVARYGGEEFVLLLPQTGRAGAARVAHRVLEAVQSLQVHHEGSPAGGMLSVSIGVGCHDDGGPGQAPEPELPSAADLVRAAEQALDAAKNAGGACAWIMDISEADLPGMARKIRKSEPNGEES